MGSTSIQLKSELVEKHGTENHILKEPANLSLIRHDLSNAPSARPGQLAAFKALDKLQQSASKNVHLEAASRADLSQIRTSKSPTNEQKLNQLSKVIVSTREPSFHETVRSASHPFIFKVQQCWIGKCRMHYNLIRSLSVSMDSIVLKVGTTAWNYTDLTLPSDQIIKVGNQNLF
jgi:hypothetical protein